MISFYPPGWSSERYWITDLYPSSKLELPFFRQPQTTINDLPPELLEEIFAHYVHEPRNGTHANPSSFVSAQYKQVVNPFILGHVCRYWRHVSRSRSTLWSSIHITEPAIKHIDMISQWLALAAKSPLTLSLAMGKASASETSNPEMARQFVDLLFPHYDEWQHITIHLSHANYVSSGFQERLPRYSPPRLSYVDINYGFGMMGRGPIDDTILQFYSNPGIDSLAWYPQWYKPTSLVNMFPHWKHLKHLTYRQGYSENALTVTQVFGLLLGCPVLEHFDAIIHAEHGHVLDVLHEPIVHSHLRILDLTFHPDRSVHIFDSMKCPALEEINITFMSVGCFGVMESADPFLSFLERSACKLAKFSFNNKGAPEDVLLEILASPHLQHTKAVHLAGMRTNRAIEILTRTSADPSSLSILPRLEELQFKKFLISAAAPGVPIDVLERMLISRRKTTSRRCARETLQPFGLSPLRKVDLELENLGIWGYFRLERLTSLSVAGVRIPRFADFLKGMGHWMSSEVKVSFERSLTELKHGVGV